MTSDSYNIMYRIITIISIVACFLPFGLLIGKKLWKEPLFVLIGAYWVINGLINLDSLFNLPVADKTEDTITLIAGMLDVPIVLFIFFMAAKGIHRAALKYSLMGFLLFELIVVATKGFNFTASTIIIGAGLAVVMVYAIWGIMSYLNKVEHTPSENVMVFIYSSFLFFYGTFTIIYVFSYLTDIGNDTDNFFLYYIELFIAVLPTIYGLKKHAKPSDRKQFRSLLADEDVTLAYSSSS